MKTIKPIAANKQVKAILRSFRRQVDEILDLAISIQQIPSPTFDEKAKADFVEAQFRAVGLRQVVQDPLHNVFGCLSGNGNLPPIVLSAHIDTVFSRDTDLGIKYRNGRKPGQVFIHGPGLADNASGVAGMIYLAKMLIEHNIQTSSDIWFVGNVGEEGLGNLRGMREVVERFGPNATYLVIEGGSFGQIYNGAIGVRRYVLTIETAGGHSWGDFGQPNAIHILSHIIASLDDFYLPVEPKTSLNVGVIEGGTTINSIAARASCQIDLRSIDDGQLERLVDLIQALTAEIAKIENVSVSLEEVGNRPSGALSEESPLAVLAADALAIMGHRKISFISGSTDANIPLSQGIPAVCIGLAQAANTHRLDEYLDPTQIPIGMGQLLLLTLAVAGFDPDRKINKKSTVPELNP